MKILIVENNVILSSVWSRRFGKDHDVALAKNVKEALDFLDKNYQPDLVLLDLRLNGPNASGILVYEEIRKACDSKVPVLIITGLEDSVPLYQQACKISEIDEYTHLYQKPIDINIIKRYLSNGV